MGEIRCCSTINRDKGRQCQWGASLRTVNSIFSIKNPQFKVLKFDISNGIKWHTFSWHKWKFVLANSPFMPFYAIGTPPPPPRYRVVSRELITSLVVL